VGVEQEQERHFPKYLGNGASLERFFCICIFIYYNAYILKKHAECQINCRIYENMHFVLLVDEYYIIMKLEMASMVH
jgi:hypothetical protein